MATMAENVLVVGAENRPPMLEKCGYDSWQSRILLYIEGQKNGEMLLDSINNGPCQFKEITIPATETTTTITRMQELSDLTPKEKTRRSCDIKAINIILLGLPSDIYTLVNHHKIARDIWNKVKELMEGTELTKQERELKLYDKFDRFTHNEVVPSFLPTDDPIASLNKAMMFLRTAFNSRFSPTNNQLKTSYNPRTQAAIQDGKVTVHNVKGRQSQGYGVNTGKEKMLLAQAQEASVILKEEQQDFLADRPCEAPTASAIFMARLSPAGSVNGDDVGLTYDSNILSEVPNYDTYHETDMLDPIVQEMEHSEQLLDDNDSHTEFMRQPMIFLANSHVFFVRRITAKTTFVGIKRLHDDLGVNTAKVRVTAAKHNLVLLVILVELTAAKEEMDLETAQTTTTAKLPILKQGEYDMWRLRIEQYFQVQDYALWDVIENINAFKPTAQTTTNADGTSTTLIPGPVTTKEKVQMKNDVKARSVLLMALPNEHLLTFNQYKDAKTFFAAIKTRCGFRRLNKPDLDTMSFDDLYNNFKIVEQKVKGTASSSSSSSSQNMAFVSFPSSTNEVNTTYGVSTANTQVSPTNTQVSTASTQVSTANLSDDNVYAFLASQPNGSQLVYKDLEQIYEDDIEDMDLKWQLALLSMRTRRWSVSTATRWDTLQGNAEDIGTKIAETGIKTALEGLYMTNDEVPTNMALMAFSDSKVHNDKTCSKTYLKIFETLKTQLDDLRIDFNKYEFNLATYKRGLASVEEQLVFYKKNEVIFCEQIVVLKRDISYKDSEISMLKSELEKLKQEKESNQLKFENFDNASKSLDKLIGSHIPDKSRKGVGFLSYNDVPPPSTGLFSPPKFDLSNSSLEEFQQPEFEGYGPKTSKSVSEDISNEVRESPDALLVEKLVSDDKLEKKTVFPTVAKIEFGHPQKEDQGYVDST
ncbi:hypothetical protein Tco_0543168 [Tanacetum coccineum]